VLIKILRSIYRPFQDDKDWEWPFTKNVIQKINSNFKIEGNPRRFGRSKYGVLLNLLPLGNNYKSRVIAKMVEKDWNIQKIEDIYPCMHTTMLLRKI
jgi:hypothetical protein